MKVLQTTDSDNRDVDGKESETIEPQDAVLIDFEAFLANDIAEADASVDSPTAKIFQQVKSWLVIVGEGDVIPALEMGIRFMETGQTALIWSHSKYALGPGTRAYSAATGDGKSTVVPVTVPPRSAVAYKVKVLQKVMDTSRLNPYFTLQKAETKKKIANDTYQHEWCPPPTSPDDPDCQQAMARAIRLYTKTAKEMETLLDGNYFAQVEKDHPQRKQAEKILMDSLNNITAVYLRQKEYSKAKQSAVNVLTFDSSNIKALLRAAKAALLDPASSYEEVEAALKAADDEITYKNPQEEKDLKKLKVQSKKQQQQYKERTKAMFGDKLAATDTKPTKSDSAPSSSSPTDGGGEGKEKSTTESTKQGEDKVNNVDGAVDKTGDVSDEVVGEDEKEERFAFWWSQLYAMVGQVIVPLILVLLYRYFYLEKTDNTDPGT